MYYRPWILLNRDCCYYENRNLLQKNKNKMLACTTIVWSFLEIIYVYNSVVYINVFQSLNAHFKIN